MVGQSETRAPRREQDALPEQDALRILLVEDNPADTRLIRETLSDAGDRQYILTLAGGVAEASDHLHDAVEFDLVLLDLNLPDSQGLQTIDRIRAQAVGVPLVVLTGLDDGEFGVEALHRGAQDYVMKGMAGLEQLPRTIRYAVGRHGLVRELEQARGELERRVAERTAELAEANCRLRAEVAERRSAQEEVQRKNRELEALLYVTSHDLKEPLRGIRGFSDLLHDRCGDGLGERGRRYVDRVHAAAGRMQRLIDDILRLAKVRRSSDAREEVDAREIVDDALARLGDRLESSNARVHVEDELPRLYVCRTWAVEAVYNLIANAVKFTCGDGSPDIEIAPYVGSNGGAEACGLVVRDRGPGVSPEQRERIFRLFQRGVSSKVEGTGAGLAIVKEVAERHDGSAWMIPRAGGGSEFVVTFRKYRQHTSGKDA